MAFRRGIYGLLLFLQAALILTGGAVRLTGSGLGCPTWPECTPGSYTPVPNQAEGALHAWIEFGNRLLTFGLVAISLVVLAHVLITKRRDLRLLAAGQLLGILGQGVLGGITVLTDLHPLPVASHLLLSIILVAAAVSLYDRREVPVERIKQSDTLISMLSRSHIALSFIVIVLGTLVTGSGPHAGDVDAPRLDFHISTITRLHSSSVWTLLIITFIFYRSKDLRFETKKWLNIFILLAIAQGALGYIQYWLAVPELLVGFHLLGSVLVWIAAWRIRLSVVRKHA